MTKETQQIILAIIAILGGGAGIISAIFTFFRDRYMKSVDALYAKELEAFRSDLNQKREFESSLIGFSAQQQSQTFSKVIEAQIAIWNEVLEVRRFCSPYLYIFNFLVPHEYNDIFTDTKLTGAVPHESRDEFDKKALELLQDKGIECWRPFLGERVWLYFFLYRAFSMREAYKVNYWYNKRNMREWDDDIEGKRKDDFYTKYLNDMMTEEEYRQLLKADLNPVSSIINFMETKLLSEVNYVLFGKHSIEVNLNYIKFMQDLKKNQVQ